MGFVAKVLQQKLGSFREFLCCKVTFRCKLQKNGAAGCTTSSPDNFARGATFGSGAYENGRTRSSAVAVIADRTAYDVRYNGKLSNRLQVYERLVHTIRFNGYRELMNAPKLRLLKRDDLA